MARLNTRISTLSNTSSRYRTATPQPHVDQENMDPDAPALTDKIARSEPPSAATTLPTPPSAEDRPGHARGQKRKRVAAQTMSRTVTPGPNNEEEQFTKYFDPYQDASARRDLKKRARDLDRTFRDRRDELLKDDGVGLIETIQEADALYAEVKQTGDASLDSRLLVEVSEVALKSASTLRLGSNSTGIDPEEFMSKLLSYMRNSGPVPGGNTQPSQSARRRRATQLDDEDEIENTPLDWEYLGRNACYPNNARPPVRTFLLGPLSLEKKQRAQTQRRTKNARDATQREARPEAITREDLAQNESISLTAQCTAIRRRLKDHVRQSIAALKEAGVNDDNFYSPASKEKMQELRLGCCIEHDGDKIEPAQIGAPLLQYVINPHSFAQTVENIFYASFLIKEGSAGIGFDDNELPVLFSCNPRSVDQQRKQKVSKHQAVVSIDYGTWQDLIQAYNITEPMIPHREEEQAQLGARGWYS